MRALRRYTPDFNLDEPIPSEILERMEVKGADFFNALREIEPSSLREIMVEIPEVKWDDVGGLREVKEKLIDAVERPINEPESFEKMGISPSKGILLYGPPGTGKTLLAKAAAYESGANFISVKGPEVLSKWVGDSEKAVREIFKKARQAAPAIIFLDELDALAPERGDKSDTGVTDRIVNQLLTSFDNIEANTGILVVGATNRPDKIDSALLRAGRFDHRLLVSIPDKEERKEIFKIHTRKMPLSDDVKFEDLLDLTDSYVGADIESVCREAGLQAIKDKTEEVKMKHFLNAIDSITPSVDEEILQMYEDMEEFMEKTVRKKKDYNGVGLYR